MNGEWDFYNGYSTMVILMGFILEWDFYKPFLMGFLGVTMLPWIGAFPPFPQACHHGESVNRERDFMGQHAQW